MDFASIIFILWMSLLIYFYLSAYRFLLSLNPYDFTSTQKTESYDPSTKKVKKNFS